MSTFRFLHASDLHLDTPFTGLGPAPPEIAERLRDASLEAFDALVELALREKVAFVLIAGDGYDGPERGLRAQLRFLRGVERLAAGGIETFMVEGRREQGSGWTAVPEWPDGVHVFGAELESRAVVRAGSTLATVHGLSHADGGGLAGRFKAARTATGGAGLQIGLLHGVMDGEEAAPQGALTPEKLEAAGLDYWALGGAHRPRVVREGGPWIVFPGTPQARAARPDGGGAHGAVLVEAGAKGVTRVEPVALDRVRLATIELDISDIEDAASLEAALEAAAERAVADAGGRALVLRARLAGRGALHAELRNESARESVLRALRGAAAGREPFLWWDSVRLDGAGGVDREAVRRRRDFAAEVLARADALAAERGRLEVFVSESCRELRGRTRRWIEEPEAPAPAAVLADGLAAALELLEEEDA